MSQPVPQGGGPAQGSALALYDQRRYNVLLPTSTAIQAGAWHKHRLTEVQIDPDPNGADVYKVGTKKVNNKFENQYALSKPALMRIAAAAGIVWNWRDSGVVTASAEYVLYKAVGAIRMADGSWQPIMANKDIDLKVVEAELRDEWMKKIREGLYASDAKGYKTTARGEGNDTVYVLDDSVVSQFLHDKVHTALIQWRKNRLMRAETGAMLRVIRAALGLKNQFNKEELARPFIVPRVDFAPDPNDPEVRRTILEIGAHATAAVFGGGAGQQANPAFDGPQRPAIAAPGIDDEPPMLTSGSAAIIEPPRNQAPAPTVQPPAPAGDAMPWETGDDSAAGLSSTCTDCQAAIQDVNHKGQPIDAMTIAERTRAQYGRELCWGCAGKAAKAAKVGGGQ